MNPKELRKKKLARQQELLNAAKQGKRDLTTEEKAEFDILQREIDDLTRQIDAEENNNGGAEPSNNTKTLEQERKRVAEITGLCREFNIDNARADEFINNGTPVDAVRKAILEQLRADNQPIATRGTGEVSVTADEQDKFRAAAADALVMRGGITIEKPAEGARDLMGMSLRDMGIEALRDSGMVNLNRKSSDELYALLSRQFFNPTAAFPSILDQAINKAYVEGHRQAPVTFDIWTTKGTLKDFKTTENNYLAGPAGEFLEVPEGGEIKHDLPIDEKLPSRRLKTYGKQFTMTRQAFINDDIDFLSTIPARYAAAARKTINKQVYDVLTKNYAVYDGKPLFGADHKNSLVTGTGVTQQAVQKMFMALQMQKDQFGQAIIVRPTYIVVPVGYAFDMYTIFDSPTINTTSNTQAANPLYRYSSQIQIVEDATLNALVGEDAAPWYVVGDKTDCNNIQVDYLNGQEIPTIRRMETPGQLGFVWDIYLDWGVSVMDYRGIVRNPGIKMSNPLA